jgi:hypothetical protein
VARSELPRRAGEPARLVDGSGAEAVIAPPSGASGDATGALLVFIRTMTTSTKTMTIATFVKLPISGLLP